MSYVMIPFLALCATIIPGFSFSFLSQRNSHKSYNSFKIFSASRYESRPISNFKRRVESEFIENNRNPLSNQIVVNRDFDLYEILESGSYSTKLKLAQNGNIIFCDGDGSEVNYWRGSWSIYSNTMRMMIERTYEGKYTQYTVKSYYYGKVDCSHKDDAFIIEGDICDEVCDPDNYISQGRFFLVSF